MVTDPTAQLTFIVPPELASGFRLAGLQVRSSVDAEEAAAILDELIADGDRGLVGLYEPYYTALASDQPGRSLDRLTEPIVVPVPTGLEAVGVGPRARLGALLKRAVGYHMTFGDEIR